MSSLYRRASPQQARILRIVEGAVKNTTDAHPGIQISAHHRRSIAKRAAGTLTAQWPDVLAARPSEIGQSDTCTSHGRRSSHFTKASGREGSEVAKALPLRALVKFLARDLTALKAAGQIERAQAFIDALREINRLTAAKGVAITPDDTREVRDGEAAERPNPDLLADSQTSGGG